MLFGRVLVGLGSFVAHIFSACAVVADTVALSLRPDLGSLQKNPGEVNVIEEISNEELQTFFKEFSYKWQVLEN